MEQKEKNAARFLEAAGVLCPRLSKVLKALPVDVRAEVSEIRLRVGQPLSLWGDGSTWFVTASGIGLTPAHAVIASRADLSESFRILCSYSIYSHQEQIRAGYVTLPGGHRAGIGGTAVLKNGEIAGMRDITSLNIRIARQVEGCADALFRRLGSLEGGLLLAGPPASGKTTLLRDIARQLSGGTHGPVHKVTVVDERGELCGAHQGVYGNDLGPCCDVLDGFPKAEGMLLAVRSLSPEYIICDELGGAREAAALTESVNAGASVVASIHAGSLRELAARPQVWPLLESGAFAYVALLDKGRPGRVRDVVKAGDLFAQGVGRGALGVGGSGGGVPAIA